MKVDCFIRLLTTSSVLGYFSIGLCGTKSHPAKPHPPRYFPPRNCLRYFSFIPCHSVATGSMLPNSNVSFNIARDAARSFVWSTEIASAPVCANRCMDLFVFPHTESTRGFGSFSINRFSAGNTNCSYFAGPINQANRPCHEW